MTDINPNPLSNNQWFPVDIWASIFEHLAPKDIINLKQTRQYLSNLINYQEITDITLQPLLKRLNTLDAKISIIGKNNILATILEGIKRVNDKQIKEIHYLIFKHSGLPYTPAIISTNIVDDLTSLEKRNDQLDEINTNLILAKINDNSSTTLNLQFLGITRFPQSLMQIPILQDNHYWQKLKKLDCSNNRLSSLPSLDMMVSLTHLSCSDNMLTALPSFNNCVALEKIFCNNNMLTTLPSFDSCIALNSIFCYQNRLTTLPTFNNCKTLEGIFCHCNQLTTLPALDTYVNLKFLVCSDNKLTDLPALSACKNLIELSCDKNKLTTLPALEACLTLKKLRCTDNALIELPSLNNSLDLENLYCSNNQLTTLPPLDACLALKFLFCENNKLSNLPTFDNCLDLEVLCCAQNQISALPTSLENRGFTLDPQNFPPPSTSILPAFNITKSQIQNQVIENSAISSNKPNNIIKPR